jgi:hypothetical protein
MPEKVPCDQTSAYKQNPNRPEAYKGCPCVDELVALIDHNTCWTVPIKELTKYEQST